MGGGASARCSAKKLDLSIYKQAIFTCSTNGLSNGYAQVGVGPYNGTTKDNTTYENQAYAKASIFANGDKILDISEVNSEAYIYTLSRGQTASSTAYADLYVSKILLVG